MKAIVITRPGGPEVLQLQEVPDPVLGPEDLLVRVRAAGLNRADLVQRAGKHPQPGAKLGHEIPGLEFAGEVAAIGDRVTGFSPGDRVMGLVNGAAYAECLTIHNRLAVKVPNGMSWHEAGGTPEVYITAHDALVQCDFAAGESVLIHAAGSGVGVAGIQIARMMGASYIAGTAGDDEKLRRARELGLDLGVNYWRQDFAAEIERATVGRGVDVILDVIGAEYWARNLRALAMKGRMVVVGTMGGSQAELDLRPFMQRRISVRGTGLRARPLEEKASATRAFEKSVLPHISSGRIKVIVDKVFALAEAAEAQAYMASNANFGKVILEVA